MCSVKSIAGELSVECCNQVLNRCDSDDIRVTKGHQLRLIEFAFDTVHYAAPGPPTYVYGEELVL
jgi:hypothetical protein